MQQTKQNGIDTDCSGRMTRSHGLKSRPQLKSMICLYGKCEGFSRWWSGERRRDGVNGDNAALRQNRYTFYGNYAIL